MDSRLGQTWPGFLAMEIPLAGANQATAGITGAAVMIRGSDPVGYAQDTLRSWLGDAQSQPQVVAGQGDTPAPGLLEKIGWTTGGVVLGLLILAFGLWALVKDA